MKRILAGITGAALVTGVAFAMTAPGATAQSGERTQSGKADPRQAAVECSSNDENLATRLEADIADAVAPAPDRIGVSVYDRPSETLCHYSAQTQFNSASVVKATFVGALLQLAEDEGRELTQEEQDLSWAAITVSDNDAATAIRDQLGNERIQAFVDEIGMSNTVIVEPWGSTLLTSEDQVKLLQMLTNDTDDVLTAAHKAYLLDLMANVVDDQRWGTPAGAPAELTVHVKNGWVPSAGWQNSIGSFDGAIGDVQKDYMMAVLTDSNASQADAEARIEAVANVVHRALNPEVPAWPVLLDGKQGSRVLVLQRLLNATGAGLEADGIFGPNTDAAVRTFQQNNGLSVDGIVGDETWPVLATEAKQGDSGEVVSALQERLVAYGQQVEVNGQFDAATERAVKAFQTSRALPDTGVVDTATWQHLVS
jgi:peptidoglycan hydrolase-like protein with peptidoglycan-binding domain